MQDFPAESLAKIMPLPEFRSCLEGGTDMLRDLVADAAFIASLFVEALASLSLLQSIQAISLREEFGPLLAFYHVKLAPVLAIGADLVWRPAPQLFVDAAVLSAILFFLFFIAQARKAMAPYEPSEPLNKIEAFIDWVLPTVFCAAGAIIAGPTLLPLLSIPAALFLGARRLAGRPGRFALSRSYFVNLLCLGAILGAALIGQR
jgi:hypothetical protein